MEDALTICSRCGWINIDGVGDFCNGCGVRHAAAAPTQAAVVRPFTRATAGVDAVFVLLVFALLSLLILAAR